MNINDLKDIVIQIEENVGSAVYLSGDTGPQEYQAIENSHSPNQFRHFLITFEKPFKEIPTVVVSVSDDLTGYIVYSATEITKTGFTFNISLNVAGTYTITGYWRAYIEE